MSEISSFYNTLFSIEIAVFGVITAVIFVFIQLVHSNFSHRQVKFIFKNPYLITYFLLSGIDLGLTATGSLLLSLKQHDFVPQFYLMSDMIVANQYVALLSLLLTFVSIFMFLLFVFKNLIYLQPSRILLLSADAATYPAIRSFLFKKYGIESPEEQRYFAAMGRNKSSNRRADAPTREDKLALDQKSNEADKKLETDLARYDRLKESAKSAIDPLASINDIAIQSINKADLRTLNEVTEIVSGISKEFIGAIPRLDREEGWNPDSALGINYGDYQLENMNAQIEMCERQKLDSAKLEVLDMSKFIADCYLMNKQFMALRKVFSFWKGIADNSIGSSSRVFKRVIHYYREIGEIAFDKQYTKSLDEIFRNLGWLGERLLSRKTLESKPLMRDHDYYTEYDDLLDSLLSFSSKYDYKHPDLYPLIYFDAIFVIFVQLIEALSKDKDNHDIKNDLFACVNVFCSFGENAILAGNTQGAELAGLNLNNSLEELEENSLLDAAKDAVGLLVRIGATAAAHKEKLGKESFLGMPIDEWVIDKLGKSELHEEISSKIHKMNLELSGNGKGDAVWNFITRLGSRMKTNFGFMFDPITGELYPENDPRRR